MDRTAAACDLLLLLLSLLLSAQVALGVFGLLVVVNVGMGISTLVNVATPVVSQLARVVLGQRPGILCVDRLHAPRAWIHAGLQPADARRGVQLVCGHHRLGPAHV